MRGTDMGNLVMVVDVRLEEARINRCDRSGVAARSQKVWSCGAYSCI